MTISRFITLALWTPVVAGAPLLTRLLMRHHSPDALHWIVYRTNHWIEYPFIAVWLAPLGVALWIIAIVMLVRARRARWPSLVAFSLWCLPWGVWVGLLAQAMRHVDAFLFNHLGILLPSGDPLLARIDAHICLAVTAAGALSALLIGLVTRSRRIALVILALAPLGFGWIYINEWSAAAWLGVVSGLLWSWSRHAGRVPAGQCPCGYNLAGVPITGNSVTCPECGTCERLTS